MAKWLRTLGSMIVEVAWVAAVFAVILWAAFSFLGCGPIHIHISPSHFHYDQPEPEQEDGTVTVDIGGKT